MVGILRTGEELPSFVHAASVSQSHQTRDDQSRIVVVGVQVGCCANVVVKTGHGLWQFCQVELDDYLPVLLPVCVSALSARQPPAPNTLPPPLPAQLLSSAQQWHRVEKSSAQQCRRVLYGPATPLCNNTCNSFSCFHHVLTTKLHQL